MLAGTVDHGDSLGNKGSLGAGDVQWMTAGSGIMHQEMPKGDPQRPHARLPALGQPARVAEDDGAALPGRASDARSRRRSTMTGRACASSAASSGARPDRWTASRPIAQYLDISVPPGVKKHLPIETTRHAFAYVFAGSGTFRDASQPRGVQTEVVGEGSATVRSTVGDRSLVLFDSGDEIVVQAGDEGIRFLLVSGQPIEEPVAWYGPIVMNTEEQLQQAYSELRAGTFIKQR